MCTVDHISSPNPGYLLEAPVESMASKGALFTRLLAHHKEVGLSPHQVLELLDVSREYHQLQQAIEVEFGLITEKLEIKGAGRIADRDAAERDVLLRRHAELFRKHEELFFEMAIAGQDILTDEQVERAEAIYEAEKDEYLKGLEPAIASALGPTFSFAQAKDERVLAAVP